MTDERENETFYQLLASWGNVTVERANGLLYSIADAAKPNEISECTKFLARVGHEKGGENSPSVRQKARLIMVRNITKKLSLDGTNDEEDRKAVIALLYFFAGHPSHAETLRPFDKKGLGRFIHTCSELPKKYWQGEDHGTAFVQVMINAGFWDKFLNDRTQYLNKICVECSAWVLIFNHLRDKMLEVANTEIKRVFEGCKPTPEKAMLLAGLVMHNYHDPEAQALIHQVAFWQAAKLLKEDSTFR